MNDKNSINEMAEKYKEEMMRIYSKAAAKGTTAEATPEPEIPQAEQPSMPEISAEEVQSELPRSGSKFPSPDEILRAEGIDTDASHDDAEEAEEHMRGNYDLDPAEENAEGSILEPLYNGGADSSAPLNGTGYLKTEVTTGSGASPVEGATVIISRKEGDRTLLVKMLVTGSSGETEEIGLPAPDLSYSEEPDPAEKPFAEYTLSVAADGFYTVPEITVPVFSTVRSIQPVAMIPLAEFDAQGSTDPSAAGAKGR